jgi:pSer/pThr/pTyr-binding forkhead associated (FHA) protein
MDPNRTQMAPAPSADPNRTVMGTAPTLNATQTIKPVQCPICKTFNPAGMMFCVECGLIFDRALPDDAFGAPVVRLPVLVETGGREHPIRPGVNLVGREGDVMLPDVKVSRKHAQIVSENGSLQVEDLGSTNGTLVNGERLDAGAQRTLEPGDKVSFGGVELTLSVPGAAGATQMLGGNKTAALSAPPAAERPASASEQGPPTSVGQEEDSPPGFEAAGFLVLEEKELPLKPGANTFGRKGDNDVSIADPYVSGKHGQIEVEDDGIYFTDLGSTNGTFMNGERLEPNVRTRIEEDTELVIGSIGFRLMRVANQND